MRTIEDSPIGNLIASRASQFKIGDQVEIDMTSGKDWISDWLGTTGEIRGIAVGRDGKVNITLRHDGDQFTDGFEPEDLTLTLRPQ